MVIKFENIDGKKNIFKAITKSLIDWFERWKSPFLPLRNIPHAMLCAAVACMLLSGCEQDAVPTLSEADYAIKDATVTSTGISVGDSSDKFLNAYGEYSLLVSTDGADYEYLTRESIPFDQDISIILDTFFIDGTAMPIDDICTAYGIEKENFLNTLNSESFLSSHTVVYRYMAFSFSGGYITDIISDSRDFNYESAYDAAR